MKPFSPERGLAVLSNRDDNMRCLHKIRKFYLFNSSCKWGAGPNFGETFLNNRLTTVRVVAVLRPRDKPSLRRISPLLLWEELSLMSSNTFLQAL